MSSRIEIASKRFFLDETDCCGKSLRYVVNYIYILQFICLHVTAVTCSLCERERINLNHITAGYKFHYAQHINMIANWRITNAS